VLCCCAFQHPLPSSCCTTTRHCLVVARGRSRVVGGGARVTWVCWCWLLCCHGALVLSPSSQSSSQSLVCRGYQGRSFACSEAWIGMPRFTVEARPGERLPWRGKRGWAAAGCATLSLRCAASTVLTICTAPWCCGQRICEGSYAGRCSGAGAGSGQYVVTGETGCQGRPICDGS
jgi:hypothetical protein